MEPDPVRRPKARKCAQINDFQKGFHRGESGLPDLRNVGSEGHPHGARRRGKMSPPAGSRNGKHMD